VGDPPADYAAQPLDPGEGQVFLGTAGGGPSAPAGLQLAALYRLGDATLSELELEPLLGELLNRAVKILGVDTAAILLLDAQRGELVARAARGLEEEVERGVRIPLGQGFAGRIAKERVPIYIADVDHAEILNPLLREKGVRSLLGAPLIAEGTLVGVLHVGTLTPREFTNDDAALLQVAAARVAPAIERARLFEALEQEHDAAVGLQRSLLPGRLPSVLGAPVAARYLPARDEVGGDWYDVLPLSRGMLGIAIGDVAGHGVRAAALMGELRAAMRAYALDGYAPPAVLERVDRMLQTIRERGMATAAYGVFDPETGLLRIALAGHPPPLVVSEDEAPRLIETPPSPPLGSMPYPRYTEHELVLAGGETLLLYTDGLVEVRGEPLRDGLERLMRAAAGARGAEALCERVIAALVPPEGAADDVAMVALHNEPIAEQLRLEVPADPTALAEVRRALRRWLHHRGAVQEDIAMLTLAVGEACANAVEHAYAPSPAGFGVEATEEDGMVTVIVRDAGRWRLPRGENRGRGLIIMEATTDRLDLRQTDFGTEVIMQRRLEGPP
jgi:anti-sigma regulatory factor (Ser/Thr protein kinase)/putative methionine-R-sulfoxide reductase with GAF domain